MKQNLEQLIARFRQDALDTVEPHLWSDEAVTQWLNDAQAEAAVRGRLLYESDLPAVCAVAVIAGTAGYALHASLYEITHLSLKEQGDACTWPVLLKSTEWLDENVRNWRDLEGRPQWAVQTDTRLRLVPRPVAGAALRLEGYRLPIKQLVGDNDAPEIHTAHHRHLVHWALHRGYSQPDSDGRDPGKAETAYAEFERYFGLRPDADLRRATQIDEPQVNKVHL